VAIPTFQAVMRPLLELAADGKEIRSSEAVDALAERFGLRFEEIPGSTALIRKMLFGPWDADAEFVVIPPGESIRYEHFFPQSPVQNK